MPLTRTIVLIAEDLVALSAFAIIGRRNHDEAAGWTAIGSIAETVAPFILGWLIVVAVLRLTGASAATTVRTTATRTAVAWVAAFPIAVLGRALVLGRFSPWTFYVVAFGFVLVMLVSWRPVFALIERRRSEQLVPR